MFFPFIIIMRLLFAASMVFIIGYVFGGFSKKKSLTRLTKIAAILVIILFVAANIFFTRQVFHHHKDGPFGGTCIEQSPTP
ncbi:hypothetical protein [Parapedobacter indicus]|uniref:Uncharacterized protein n=1 Tax=Parapedobacter indicus TaxID=1477437 RepID=A0A1I3GRK5_9SPHI|nr:hypothetical protein [Parapedobacter indicus]PPL02753.1 hypothetical protein CLV26_10379 [Parapedobacter indicus]SFI25991.1 hypothetical protein SAMN05444682_10378 [Parapedobacter indicus]